MHLDVRNSSSTGASPQILLDGLPISLPPQRHSLAAIRSFLETMAYEQQRILYSLRVDGRPVSLAEPLLSHKPFGRVEGQSIDLAQMPLQLVKIARRQTAQALKQVLTAVALVLINDARKAREYWWNLTQDLKQPLLTLSFMPDTSPAALNGSASLTQLRKWQLQQLAAIIKDVDQTCWAEDSTALANALETRVLPWLAGLKDSLELWHETLSIAPAPACQST
ncbi:MAG TPA: hypothetical protein VG146_07500 [Verrucomicrobiae bacterium]|nr:hypothetical protein [Verrucomicrobiae bacterium]